MTSLDVESLFTNIPLEETIENCLNDLFFDKSKIDNLTKQDQLLSCIKDWSRKLWCLVILKLKNANFIIPNTPSTY